MVTTSQPRALAYWLTLVAGALALVLAAQVPYARGRPEIARSAPSSARFLGKVEELKRIKRPHNQVHTFDNFVLDLMEELNSVSIGRAHVKYLLNEQESYDFSVQLSVVDILHRAGFRYETHEVQSDDGYITQLVRIINPLVARGNLRSPPVLMYAGQGASPAVFLMASMGSNEAAHWPLPADWPEPANRANRSLAITLANHGHDVYLVGARGSDASNKRRVGTGSKGLASSARTFELLDLTATSVASKVSDALQRPYWSFSNDELINFEFGAQLERVLAVSKQRKLSLITYSNGGFIAHAFAASKPKWFSEHLEAMVSIAPAVYTNKFNLVLGIQGLLANFAGPNSTVLDETIESFARGLWFNACRSKAVRYTKCKAALNLLYGFSDSFQTHIELSLASYTGRPVSAAGFRQSLQCSFSNRFQHYDHGPIGNLFAYNKLLPPVYNLGQVHLASSFVISGEYDAVVDQDSLARFIDELGSKPAKHIQVPGYNHLDLVAGWDVAERVNTPVLALLNEHSSYDEHYHEHRHGEHDELGGLQEEEEQHEQLQPARSGTSTVPPTFRKPTTEKSKQAGSNSLSGANPNAQDYRGRGEHGEQLDQLAPIAKLGRSQSDAGSSALSSTAGESHDEFHQQAGSHGASWSGEDESEHDYSMRAMRQPLGISTATKSPAAKSRQLDIGLGKSQVAASVSSAVPVPSKGGIRGHTFVVEPTK